jgi:MFS family permease
VAGPLADRTNRVRLLWMTLLLCSGAMALSAVSPSYGWLLACRVALGAGVAVSGPVVASLMGDYFAPSERGRVYGRSRARARVLDCWYPGSWPR